MDAVSEKIVACEPASTNTTFYRSEVTNVLYFPLYDTHLYISSAPMPKQLGTTFTYTTFNWLLEQRAVA